MLPRLARTILDECEDAQIRYAALEALRWYDTPEAIETLERIRGTLTEPEHQVLQMQVEGAINQVRQRMEASRRPAALPTGRLGGGETLDAPVNRDPRDDRIRMYFEREIRRIREERERERRASAPPPE